MPEDLHQCEFFGSPKQILIHDFLFGSRKFYSMIWHWLQFSNLTNEMKQSHLFRSFFLQEKRLSLCLYHYKVPVPHCTTSTCSTRVGSLRLMIDSLITCSASSRHFDDRIMNYHWSVDRRHRGDTFSNTEVSVIFVRAWLGTAEEVPKWWAANACTS